MTFVMRGLSSMHCGQPMVGVEVRTIYDGVCFWRCAICLAWKHRFPFDDPKRALVERYHPHRREEAEL
jgi:hypothetical protein